jgi:glycosyltransferase involved in cell wall biosynthesis
VRVLLVSKAMLGATAQKKADLLAQKHDVELSVASPPFWRADDGGKQALEATARGSWRLEVVPLWLNGHFHVYVFPTIGRLIRRLRPDIVHIDEEPYNLATYHATRAAHGAGAKVAFVTWQNLLRRYPFPFSAMERYNYHHSTYALAANEDSVSVIRRKGYGGPVSVFPQFGVDTDIFVPRAKSHEGPPRIGCVARLVEQKGVDVLLKAFAPLAGRAELVIVGRGPHEESLRRLSTDLGIAGQVRFMGSATSAEVAPIMAEFDVLVLPSRTTASWAEQFGRVLVEAMACEVAVVGSSSGEIPNVIGECGLVFPEDDVDALRACLLQLLDDSAARTALARAGRAHVLARYTQQHIADATYAAWQAMLRVPSAASASPAAR